MDKRLASIILICWSIAVLMVCKPSLLVAQRVCCEGQEWLKWNAARRTAFVDGFITGYMNGFHDGCQKGTADWPEEVKPGTEANAMTRCGHQAPDYSRGTSYLVKAVTDFYQRYPTDQDIYIREVLEQLGKGLTLEEIHNHPFWRHKPPQANP